MSKHLFESIKIPATILGGGRLAVLPDDSYPPAIIEWLDQMVVTRNWNGSCAYKICESEEEANDLWGWTPVHGDETTARVYGIHAASHLINNEAWEYAKNPPRWSVFFNESDIYSY